MMNGSTYVSESVSGAVGSVHSPMSETEVASGKVHNTHPAPSQAMSTLLADQERRIRSSEAMVAALKDSLNAERLQTEAHRRRAEAAIEEARVLRLASDAGVDEAVRAAVDLHNAIQSKLVSELDTTKMQLKKTASALEEETGKRHQAQAEAGTTKHEINELKAALNKALERVRVLEAEEAVSKEQTRQLLDMLQTQADTHAEALKEANQRIADEIRRRADAEVAHEAAKVCSNEEVHSTILSLSCTSFLYFFLVFLSVV